MKKSGKNQSNDYPQIDTLRMKDLPSHIRPREVLDRYGFNAAPDDVLLAVLLRSGVSGINVSTLARQLITKYGSLTSLAQASIDELAQERGMGKVKAREIKAALEMGLRMSREQKEVQAAMRSPRDVFEYMTSYVKALEVETFWLLLLDMKNKLKKPPVQLSSGILNASLVHPREAFKAAILSGCAAVIAVHNHPSGDPTPSSEDLQVTRQLLGAGQIVDIPLLDHIIIGHQQTDTTPAYCSIRDQGLVDFQKDAIS